MKLEETYNIHKNLNSIFPFFKSKKLCKKGIHNYRINPQHKIIPHYYQEEDETHTMIISRIINYEHIDLTNFKCFCCGKEEKIDELEGDIYERSKKSI